MVVNNCAECANERCPRFRDFVDDCPEHVQENDRRVITNGTVTVKVFNSGYFVFLRGKKYVYSFHDEYDRALDRHIENVLFGRTKACKGQDKFFWAKAISMVPEQFRVFTWNGNTKWTEIINNLNRMPKQQDPGQIKVI